MSGKGGNTMDWKDPDTRNKLFISILATMEGFTCPAASQTKIATYLGCTPKSVSHQITAIRKEIDNLKTGVLGGEGATTTTNTPATPKSGRKRKSKAEMNGDAPEGGEKSSAKKPKATPTKRDGKKNKKATELEEEVTGTGTGESESDAKEEGTPEED